MQEFDAVVVSDLHLGARNSLGRAFLDFLQRTRFQRLVIAGDMFEYPNLKGLRDQDLGVLGDLRRLSDELPVIWLQGNHDPAHEVWQNLLGIQPRQYVILGVGHRSYYVCHGDRWDISVNVAWPVVASANAIYRFSQRIDSTHRLARRLKHSSKRFCRVSRAIREGACETARAENHAGIIIGHSHVAEECVVDGVHYLNSGCWTELPCTFVGIREGRARTYAWHDGDHVALSPAMEEVEVPRQLSARPALVPAHAM